VRDSDIRVNVRLEVYVNVRRRVDQKEARICVQKGCLSASLGNHLPELPVNQQATACFTLCLSGRHHPEGTVASVINSDGREDITLVCPPSTRAMPSYRSLAVLAALPAVVLGGPAKRAISQPFVNPAESPLSASSNYVGQNNGSLPKTNYTSGKVFDRYIQIWLENTDFQTVASTPEFQALAKEGLLLDSYYALTHVSHYSQIIYVCF
jgi:hypothetical protein